VYILKRNFSSQSFAVLSIQTRVLKRRFSLFVSLRYTSVTAQRTVTRIIITRACPLNEAYGSIEYSNERIERISKKGTFCFYAYRRLYYTSATILYYRICARTASPQRYRTYEVIQRVSRIYLGHARSVHVIFYSVGRYKLYIYILYQWRT